MTLQTSNTMTNTIVEYWQEQLLTNAWGSLFQNRWSTEGIIPQKNGKTYEWYGIDNFTTTDTPLSAGVTPAPLNVAERTRVATVNWYGAYVAHSDELEYTAYHPIITAFVDQLGYQCGASINDLTRTYHAANFTTVIRPNGYSADSSITASDVMDFPLFSRAITTLSNNEGQGVEGENYACLMHPHQYHDFIQDDQVRESLREAAVADGVDPYATGFRGTLLNTNIYVSSRALVTANVGSGATVDVYTAFFFAREGSGTAGLAGFTSRLNNLSQKGAAYAAGLTGQPVKPVEVIMKPLGSGGSSDPMNQRATVAYKTTAGWAALNNNWVVLANCASSMGTNT